MIEDFLTSGAIISTSPTTLLVGWGAQSWHATPQSTSTFYFPDFFLTIPRPWLTFEHCQDFSLTDFQQELADSDTSFPPFQWENRHYPLFAEAFEDLQRRFAAGSLEKAVPFAFATAQTSMSRPLLRRSLSSLLDYAQEQPVYVYGFWGADEGMLGATPEILFRQDGKTLETVAIAGTRARGGASLLDDPKERHEHQLVIEGITSALSDVGQVDVGTTEVLELPTLSHLKTPIQVRGEIAFDKAVAALHPTPALGAFPRAVGAKWLRDYQTKLDRKRFGAPAGYHQSNTGACYVAIRNIQWDAETLFLGAGCGVVPASTLEQEWAEINLKMESVKEILRL